jgi:signal transduction histidine kinase
VSLGYKWNNYLLTQSETHTPGLIGGVPYLLVLRLFVILAVIVRFELPFSKWTGQHSDIWVVIATMSALAAAFAWHWLRPPALHKLIPMFVALDVIAISRAYYLTDVPESDFWLFFYLPILTAAEFLRFRHILMALGFVIVGLCAVLGQFIDARGLGDLIVMGCMRGGFLIAITTVSAFRTHLDRTRNARLGARNGQMGSLLDFQRRVTQDLKVWEILTLTESALQEYKIVSAIGFWASNGVNADWHNDVRLSAEKMEALARAEKSLRSEDPPETYSEQGSEALIAVPLRTFNRMQGLLFAFSRSRQRLPAEVKPFLLSMAETAATAIVRATALRIIGESSQATLSAPAGDAQITWLLDHLTRENKMDFAAVSAIDPYTKMIAMIRAANVQPGWMQRTKYSLDHKDIIADIARTKKAEILLGWDRRFDPETFELYGHDKLARIFAPMFHEGEVVGVLETGCSKDRAEHVREIFAHVEALARNYGGPVAAIRFSDALASIAKGAMEIIGAESATIHLYKGDEITYQASAGLALEHDFVHLYPPRRAGIGRVARRDQTDLTIEDPETVRTTYPHLYQAGIRSLAAYPLKMTEDHEGVLYLHFTRPHTYSKAEATLVESVLGFTEGAILSRQLLDEIADSAKWGWMVASQQPVIQSLVGNRDLRSVLEDLVRNMRLTLGADSVVLYAYNDLNDSFELPVQHGVRTWAAPTLTADSTPRNVLRQYSNEPFFGEPNDGAWGGEGTFVAREGIQSCAAVVIQPDRTSKPAGVLFVNYRGKQDFPLDRKQAIKALAASAAIAIGTARLHEKANRSLSVYQRELEALSDIDLLIARGMEDPNRDEVLDLILSHSMKIAAAEDGAIHVVEGDMLRVLCKRGFDGLELADQVVGQGVVGQAAKGRSSISVPDVSKEPNYVKSKPTTCSEIAVPLKDHQDVLAVINLEHSKIEHFDNDHEDALKVLALQGVIAIRSVEAYQRFQRPLRAMGAVANRVQRRDEDLNIALRLVLTGITAKQGLGFTRAMIFRQEGGRLTGLLAIGPWDRDEALESDWPIADAVEKTANSHATEPLEALLDLAEQAEREILAKREMKALDAKVRQTQFYLPNGMRIVPDRIPAGTSHPLRSLLSVVSDSMDAKEEFAVVPLREDAEHTVGAIIVDRAYQARQKSISDADLKNLEAFGELATLAMKIDRVRGKLSDRSKQEEWEAILEDNVHDLRRELNDGRDSATAFGMKYPALPGELRQLLNELGYSYGRAFRAIKRIRDYARPMGKLSDTDLVVVVEDAVAKDEGVTFTPPSEPIPVLCAPDALKNAMRELVANAKEAADAKGLPVRVKIELTADEDPYGQRMAKLAVEDGSGGIAPEIRADVEKRYVSTKNREQSGLGLPIVRKVAERHGGRFNIEDIDGGTRIVLTLPVLAAVKEGDSHAKRASG